MGGTPKGLASPLDFFFKKAYFRDVRCGCSSMPSWTTLRVDDIRVGDSVNRLLVHQVGSRYGHVI